ncbi:MAG: hypothetical protein GY769_09500 [bacterium]|nr:hypothetical protein [bacterium]
MRASGFGLVPLDCPTCGAALAAAGEDVVFYCTACRNGYRYQVEEPHLVPLEVQFVAAANIAAERYMPFWVLEARVEVRRQSGRGMPSLIHAFFGGGGEERAGEGTFVVPAFRADLDATVELVRRYTEAFPGLDQLLGEKLTGGCFDVADARKLAHFAVVAGEVDQRGVLRTLDYSMTFGEARLLGVPFARDRDGWKDAVHGIRIQEQG